MSVSEMDVRYLSILPIAAKQSHDPDTQVSCVVKDPNGVLVYGTNRLPKGIVNTPERVTRPGKYTWLLHAEQDAIACAARNGVSLDGSTMYLSWFPCARCALLMVQAGVVRVVANLDAYIAKVNDPRYSFAEAMDILAYAGVVVEWV